MNKLCLVRQVGYDENLDIKVGSYLVRNGAWQRKYEVVAITELVGLDARNLHYMVELKPLGNFYATGLVKLARKGVHSEHHAIRTVMPDGKLMKLYIAGYIHVVPFTQKPKLRSVK